MHSPETRVPELDGVRGVACLLVLVHHYALGIATFEPGGVLHALRSALYPLFLGGVDLFFVLSGFLISGILMDHRGSQGYYRVFWTRRAARILPVYVMLFASFYLALALRPDGAWPWADEWLLKPPLPFWSYATFTQNFAMAAANDPGAYWVGITWSLAIEEQFYLVLPFIVAFAPRRFIVGMAITCIVAAPLLRTAFWEAWGWWAAYTLLPSRMENLMCGVLVACLVRNPRALGAATRHRRLLDAVLLVLVALVSSQVTYSLGNLVTRSSPLLSSGLNWFQYTLISLMFALALLRVFLYRDGWFNAILKSRLLVGAGMISYGVYMYHQAVNGLLQGLILGQQPRFATWADAGVAALSTCVVLAIAIASYRFVEMPIRRRAQRVKYGSRPVRPGAAPGNIAA